LPSVTSEYVPHHTLIALMFKQSACVKAGSVTFSSECGEDAGILMKDGYNYPKLGLRKMNRVFIDGTITRFHSQFKGILHFFWK